MKLKPLYDIIDYLGIFQKYLGVRMYIVYLLGVIASVFEGLGILMLLPLLESLDGNNTSQAPHFINDIILNVLSFLGFSQSISSILILISLAFVFKGIITFSALAYRANLIGELLKEIKQNLYALYSLMDFRYYTSKNTGDFINLINSICFIFVISPDNNCKRYAPNPAIFLLLIYFTKIFLFGLIK